MGEKPDTDQDAGATPVALELDRLLAAGGRSGLGGRASLNAGAAVFVRLKALGVDYVFTNSGTDFPPIIEGLAQAEASGVALPQALIMPHEHAAMGMAHGYTLATGKAQAVMLHTNVGLANGAIGAINAATDQIPMFLMSGRTPVTEKDRFGARTVPIGWGQEMRDQSALVREACKWDYELRFPEQVADLLDRANAIANSTPKGPVYLSLPREVLCEPCPADRLARPPGMAPTIAAPDPDLIAGAAALIANAKRPVIFAQRGAGSADGFAALSKFAEDWAIPVCHWWAVALAVASDHPAQVGSDPEPWLSEADVILVIDALAPWSPDVHQPHPDAKIVQLGPDPLFSRVPVRNFRSDISIATETTAGIAALAAAMEPQLADNRMQIDARRVKLNERIGDIRAGHRAAAEAGPMMTKAYVSRCLSDAISGLDATVLSELGCPLDQLDLKTHGSWRQEPHSGGLGWSFPCAMGMQLADRERLIIATMGDGSYIFSNPVACHQVAEALELPVLLLVLNNQGYGAVSHSVLGMYPDGHAAKTNRVPLTGLRPSPDFTKVAAASRAYALPVDKAEDLPGALRAAIRRIRERKRLVLMEIAIA